MLDTRLAKGAVAGLGLLVGGTALPAVGGTAGDPPVVLAQASSFDDEKIAAFVTATNQVQEIRAT